MIFKNRQDAGKKLIPRLEKYKNSSKAIILGLPRGGVINAFEVAQGLNLPLDVIIVRKIGAPDNPELAIGALVEGGITVFNEELISIYNLNKTELDKKIEEKEKEISIRSKIFRSGQAPLDLNGKIAILIDDGVATGATVRAAIKAAKAKNAEKIVLAVPVIARDTLNIIKQEADEVIYLDAPLLFGAVGAFYEDFTQIEDEKVVELLKKARNKL